MLAGGALSFVYPWAAANFSGYEVGTWRVYERERGFTPAEASLAAPDAPVFATLELATQGPLARSGDEPVLTVTADAGGKTVLAQTLVFDEVEPSVVNPQAGGHLYRLRFARIDPVEGDRYLFTFGPGVAAQEQLVSADLVLVAGAFDLDPRAIPAGYVLMAVGLVGFVASLRRRRPDNPNSGPPPPRWGRG